jgi:hypothetical protein
LETLFSFKNLPLAQTSQRATVSNVTNMIATHSTFAGKAQLLWDAVAVGNAGLIQKLVVHVTPFMVIRSNWLGVVRRADQGDTMARLMRSEFFTVENREEIPYRWTMLQAAALDGDPEVVANLLAVDGSNGKPMDPDLSPFAGRTALHYAFKDSCPSQQQKSRVAVVDVLLKAGASTETTDWRDMTPLHYAVARPDPQSVRRLLEAGADANHHGDTGQTPLQTVRETVADAEARLHTHPSAVLRHRIDECVECIEMLEAVKVDGCPVMPTTKTRRITVSRMDGYDGGNYWVCGRGGSTGGVVGMEVAMRAWRLQARVSGAFKAKERLAPRTRLWCAFRIMARRCAERQGRQANRAAAARADRAAADLLAEEAAEAVVALTKSASPGKKARRRSRKTKQIVDRQPTEPADRAEPIEAASEPVEPIKPASEPVEPIGAASEPVEPIKPAAEPVESDLCVVCLDGPRQMAYIPCGHHCTCGGCSDLSTCPMCREPVVGQLRVYG